MWCHCLLPNLIDERFDFFILRQLYLRFATTHSMCFRDSKLICIVNTSLYTILSRDSTIVIFYPMTNFLSCFNLFPDQCCSKLRARLISTIIYQNHQYHCMASGVGVTKPIFSVPLFSQCLKMIKRLVTCIISRSYLTGVTAAELRRHLTNVNVIEII